MKKSILMLGLLISVQAMAENVTGKLVLGGGIDDLGLSVQLTEGQIIYVYCDGNCGDWFDEDSAGNGNTLKKNLKGKKVEISYILEKNKGRIAGPAEEDKLFFIKKIKIFP